jgi:cytochrome c-type biogenesis protein CcsB
MLLKIGRAGAFIANVLLFFILSSRWIVAGYFPLSNLYESLLFLTWALLATYLYVEHKTKSKLIGATLIPVALLVSGFANLTLPPEMQKASPLVPALQSNWLMMHVSMMMLSYSTLIVGSLLSILFLIISKGQEIEYIDTFSNSYSTDVEKNTLTEIGSTISLNTIKDSKLKLLFNIDNWSYRVIGLGFPFLTIGIIAGGVWANEAWGSYWSWDPKETWALITWLVFAAYLHARITKNWQGKRTAILGSLGFFVIWICYLGVNFLGKGLHSYGWLS